MTTLYDREETILDSLREFYSNNEYIKIIKPIIEGQGISLRVIDWFVTNYCKKNAVVYPIIHNLG